MRSPRPAASSIAFMGLSYRIVASAGMPEFLFQLDAEKELWPRNPRKDTEKFLMAVIAFRVFPWIPWL
jgi:hypothetical protein